MLFHINHVTVPEVMQELIDSRDIHIILEGKIDIYKVNAKSKEIVLKQFLPFSFITVLYSV